MNIFVEDLITLDEIDQSFLPTQVKSGVIVPTFSQNKILSTYLKLR